MDCAENMSWDWPWCSWLRKPEIKPQEHKFSRRRFPEIMCYFNIAWTSLWQLPLQAKISCHEMCHIFSLSARRDATYWWFSNKLLLNCSPVPCQRSAWSRCYSLENIWYGGFCGVGLTALKKQQYRMCDCLHLFTLLIIAAEQFNHSSR